jgi:hypothetical protein
MACRGTGLLYLEEKQEDGKGDFPGDTEGGNFLTL